MNKEKYAEKLEGNKHFMFIAFTFCAQLLFSNLFFIDIAYAQKSVSVGVVDVTFLMENAPQSELASHNLKEKFLPQEKKLAEELEKINNLELELKKFTIAKKTTSKLKRLKERELRSLKRARSRSLQDFREELRFARDAALDDVQKEVFSAINKVRELQDIDIVLQDYISANKRVDITPQVLDFLKNKIGKGLPVVDKKSNNKMSNSEEEAKK